jgi:hypothetical protein
MTVGALVENSFEVRQREAAKNRPGDAGTTKLLDGQNLTVRYKTVSRRILALPLYFKSCVFCNMQRKLATGG